MSHFPAYIIVPADTPLDQIESFLEQVLAPYDEGLKVQPYEEECFCVVKARHKDSSNPQPDQECSSCRGSGTCMSTYNPDSKWDWWVIGGRWDGWIQDDPQSSEGGFNFSECHHTVAKNSASVDDLLQLKGQDFERLAVPFALVDGEGCWHERGRMGWFACTTDEKPDSQWRREVRAVYRQNRSCRVVCCDLHI